MIRARGCLYSDTLIREIFLKPFLPHASVGNSRDSSRVIDICCYLSALIHLPSPFVFCFASFSRHNLLSSLLYIPFIIVLTRLSPTPQPPILFIIIIFPHHPLSHDIIFNFFSYIGPKGKSEYKKIRFFCVDPFIIVA